MKSASVSQAHGGPTRRRSRREGWGEGERQLSHNIYKHQIEKVHAQLSSQEQVFFSPLLSLLVVGWDEEEGEGGVGWGVCVCVGGGDDDEEVVEVVVVGGRGCKVHPSV